ncbi:extracellular solute-binding protein [Aestuariirhabdus litorea]|uniref:Extracellular solute-binding protein n=1 Tax=Aestuariirhabdus litorea TaxID=2528527 RepID=A0A3P3VV49_9GAMM|nr:extracellular solute-binding protein [Aestuariirhabdus litorea]RRJ85309.1 extracellular solute-binding protein [Aestuariirhabdus litorea]RWW98531.1 extracellular solute-binding protein [Endozoicomonadaceae bacterium GTF-13]
MRRFIRINLMMMAALLCLGVGADTSILVQSTTSTANSGLYDLLLPQFKARTGITVNVVAVGTGQAIKNAMNGDADVLLVHAKSAEEKFVAEGYGVERFDLMYNDFIVVGPANDPAGIAGGRDAVVAFEKIAESKALFVSRSDNSGTHKKEQALWRDANINTEEASGGWYRETGSGMGATLNAAAGMGAYSLTDRGTWISFKNRGSLAILVEGDRGLFNQYGVIMVNPAKHPKVKAEAAQQFIDWLTGPEGQQAINDYQLNGQQLFFANARR